MLVVRYNTVPHAQCFEVWRRPLSWPLQHLPLDYSFPLEAYQLSRAVRVREESKHIHCAESMVPKLLRFPYELHVQTDNLAVASSDTMVPVERALAR